MACMPALWCSCAYGARVPALWGELIGCPSAYVLGTGPSHKVLYPYDCLIGVFNRLVYNVVLCGVVCVLRYVWDD